MIGSSHEEVFWSVFCLLIYIYFLTHGLVNKVFYDVSILGISNMVEQNVIREHFEIDFCTIFIFFLSPFGGEFSFICQFQMG